ncbi:MAG: tripartite tricarboxylate transporter substrate binding protein [Pusillimonas sp.]
MSQILSIACVIAAIPLTASLALASPAVAPDWPNKPVTIIVPFPPGGGTDLVMRSIQPVLSKALGQPVVIDNRAGAGGTVGSALVAQARGDGYTAGVVTTSTHAVSPSIYPDLRYDPVQDFSYAGFIGTSPYVLVANPSLGVKNVLDLIEAMRAHPSNQGFASVGVGTVSHLMGEQFKKSLDIPIVHVPYRGAAPAYTDLIGGQVQIMFDNPVGLKSFIDTHKLTALATTESTPLLPDVPTFAEQGIDGFNQSLWYGVAFPKDTPDDIVQHFNSVLNAALRDPAVAADLASKGVTARADTPSAMQEAVARDVIYWGGIVKSVGATNE